jgi:hypothetical protein
MSSPRHLWSGDWQQDSAALAEERARRRAQPEAPVEPPEPETSGTSSSARGLTLLRRLLVRLAHMNLRPRLAQPRARRRPILRVAVLVAIAALLVAGAAYGLSALGGSGGSGSVTAASGSRPFLGVQTQSVPVGRVLISAVVPGSPADRAGLGAGDVVNEIDNRPIASPGDVEAVIAGLHPGDSVRIQVQRGPLTYTAQATLAAWPRGYP